ALIVILAALGCGRLALRIVRAPESQLSDALLIGFATFGILSAALALISTAIVPVFAVVMACVCVGQTFLSGRPDKNVWPTHPLLAIAIGIAFLCAIAPVNSPDELV